MPLFSSVVLLECLESVTDDENITDDVVFSVVVQLHELSSLLIVDVLRIVLKVDSV